MMQTPKMLKMDPLEHSIQMLLLKVRQLGSPEGAVLLTQVLDDDSS